MTIRYNEFDSIWAPPDTAVDDNGTAFDSINDAIANADTTVLVGPGTFSENVVVDKAGLTLKGSGRGTVIDGGSDGIALSVTANNTQISDLEAKTTQGTGADRAVNLTGDNSILRGVVASESDDDGISVVGSNNQIIGCIVMNTDDDGFITQSPGDENVYVGCIVKNTVASTGINLSGNGSDHLSGCLIDGAGSDGVLVNSDDNAITGCTIIGAGSNGINDNGTDNIYDGNRIGGSATSDIDSASATTPLNGDNKTGAI